MAANYSSPYELPPLPEYTLRPQPPVVSWIPDSYLTLILPIIGYWVVSLFFHFIDVYDLFPQYRLHTPVELLKRNHASRWDVLRDVILQQIIQTLFGLVLAQLDGESFYGKEEYDVSVWAQRIRIAQRVIPSALAFVGIDAIGLSIKVAASHKILAGVIAGGQYPWLSQLESVTGQSTSAPAFASWELSVAHAIYYYVVPALQFLFAISFVDTWQYFLHRAMHMNKWLYTQFHARHHRLYVPYAYGALYNHPVEGFALDTLGTGLAYLASGLTVRQSMWLFTCSTIKTVDDHCGYALPFDPLQLITSNNAAYHDIHHQSWGIKTNFSQPFFTYWDRLLGTIWKGDVSLKYERSRVAAQRHMDKEQSDRAKSHVPEAILKPSIFEQAKVNDLPLPAPQPISTRRSPRKKNGSFSQQSIKGLRDRVNQNLQGKGGNLVGVESSH
ncbi:hypothetical protein EJ05DRAFT_44428 [Pseudovirgaria hyperparasitica]|uniref:Fatty acid hydroxylase domain-containing protein n=1 Tax=Pseudovirgaria hyperparasitica TaxID=470096 RepID=A0A6A6W3S8_9PEZI|nr:uncharacterized protein EJ05DRAFT_44428 [Pseudovirgaria hyperparasitica]KAF2756809.1 hypothetical protein EJ05DRAFT_44428 [Pseudovirgaria hyperparasitica]